MHDFISGLVDSLGYLGVALLMGLFASEAVMPLAGYVAWSSHLTLWGVVLAGSAGSTIGSVVLYLAARFIDDKQVHYLVSRYGKWAGLSSASLTQSERWFDRHAKKSVCIGKFLPGLRSAVSVSAGYRRMPIGSYLICTFGATAVWTGLLASLGYTFGVQYDQVQQLAQYAAGGSSTVVVTWLIVTMYRRRQHQLRVRAGNGSTSAR